ncbi:regulator component [Streptomyces sp. NPDC050560]|uniref:regulator component n=1 Tax=Streptomyces sp. NPDC050560 TaxID=3365630 RepID=UPI0037886F89
MPVPRGLRKEVERVLARLPIPTPFTVDGFRAALEEQRGREIVMEELPRHLGRNTPCGLWFAMPSVDVIFSEANTSPYHRDQIRLHELGHLVLDHRRALTADIVGPLLPDLMPEFVADRVGDSGPRPMGRTSYNTEEEAQAEVFARALNRLLAPDQQYTDPTERRIANSLRAPAAGRQRWWQQ